MLEFFTVPPSTTGIQNTESSLSCSGSFFNGNTQIGTLMIIPAPVHIHWQYEFNQELLNTDVRWHSLPQQASSLEAARTQDIQQSR